MVTLLPAFAVAQTPGRDGAYEATTIGEVVNRYAVLDDDVSAEATAITVTDIADLAGLAAGDLLMIIQMQGASIDTDNNGSYGTVTDLNGAGLYEFVTVGAVSENDITLHADCVGGLKNAYSADDRTQVIRVPQYTSLTVPGGTSLAAQPWDGETGGVVVVHTRDGVVVDGRLDVSAQGFRGGAFTNGSRDNDNNTTDWVDDRISRGGEKGEGIAGSQDDYDDLDGRYSRGAPANGGGGGTAHNGGGGGGANGNNGLSWTGHGVMDSNGAWTAAWQQDPAYDDGLSNSSGGGRGGYTYSSNNRNALAEGPGGFLWGGNRRRERGGRGGRPLDADPRDRIFLGGGGGAGDGNNNAAGIGGDGGGIVYLITPNVTGAGSLVANGQDGARTRAESSGNDGPGGAGAGGTVIVTGTVADTLSIVANGGEGGDQFILEDIPNEAEGPGGGGGGGYVAVASGTPTISVAGGTGGDTDSASLTEFTRNGATNGASGLVETVAFEFTDIPFCFPVCGNGLTTGQEACDAGEANGTTTCGCSETCQYPDGETACGDDLFCNGVEVCDGAGACGVPDSPCSGEGETCDEELDVCTFCGDGVTAADEECDDGEANGTTACGCDDVCTFVDSGTACADDLFCNGVEVCNGVGACSSGDDAVCSEDETCDEDADVCDECPDDPDKLEPGVCGCGDADVDTDEDGALDCNDPCPLDPDDDADDDGLCASECEGEDCVEGPCTGPEDEDCSDNCPDVSNPDQLDTDGDGTGDACEEGCEGDLDCDEVPDDGDDSGDPDDNPCEGGATEACDDNCPEVYNPDQADDDGNGVGDACQDDCPGDTDCDEVPDDGDDSGDPDDNPCEAGSLRACDDNCVIDHNPLQRDLDGDGLGDVCDDDQDGDGILDEDDNCPHVYNVAQADTDEDGIGNACEDDTDDDGILDDGDDSDSPTDTPCEPGESEGCDDNCTFIPNTDQADLDGDGDGDLCDLDADGDGTNGVTDCDDLDDTVAGAERLYPDDDGDGVGTGVGLLVCPGDPDSEGLVSVTDDNCPDVANPDQEDDNGNGLGDLCDGAGYSVAGGGAATCSVLDLRNRPAMPLWALLFGAAVITVRRRVRRRAGD